jgi:hypothetical protein
MTLKYDWNGDVITRDIICVLTDLPKICALINAVDGTANLIRRGETGYYPWPYRTEADVDRFNERHNVTPAQKEAMKVGSMFGFDVPGADPLNC